jgi:hypothetical protein
MVNKLKRSGADGYALQVTKQARTAGLVEEDSNGEATRRADVRVYSFDHLLLVVDIERVSDKHTSELVASAARDTKSVFQAIDAGVHHAGNGYQVQLPPAEDAGFERGDKAPCRTARGILAIVCADGTSAGRQADRLARDIVAIREEQIN